MSTWRSWAEKYFRLEFRKLRPKSILVVPRENVDAVGLAKEPPEKNAFWKKTSEARNLGSMQGDEQTRRVEGRRSETDEGSQGAGFSEVNGISGKFGCSPSRFAKELERATPILTSSQGEWEKIAALPVCRKSWRPNFHFVTEGYGSAGHLFAIDASSSAFRRKFEREQKNFRFRHL